MRSFYLLLQAIPFLDRSFLNGNADTPPPQGTVLVRYVGMVQDMCEVEYYLSEVNGVNVHYRDVHLPEMPQDDYADIAHKLAERQPLVVVPTPFASDWFRDELHTAAAAPTTSTTSLIEADRCHKRERDEVAVPPTKRTVPSTPDTSMEDSSVGTPREASPVAASRADQHVSSNSDWWPAGCMDSDPNQCPVLAKMYYEQDPSSSRLRLNEVVELIGVLSVDPMDADFYKDDHLDDFMHTVMPPPSLLPRLHVLCYNRLNLEHATPDDNAHTDMDIESTSKDDQCDDRKLAIQVFSEYVFDGNETAAEALLMVLMSMAEREQLAEHTWTPIRTPSDAALGCASLNLVLSSEAACAKMYSRLQRVLSEILPVVGGIQLTLDNLKETIMSPAKSESGRLEPSHLQLPKGAALIINQASLSEGRIDARATETLEALNSLTQNHSVPYRFEGNMKFYFEADYRVIVLSSAVRGRQKESAPNKLLPCAMQMNLPDAMQVNETSVPESLCKRIRSYLTRCRSNVMSTVEAERDGSVFNVPLTKTLLELAQKDFIEKRAQHRARAEQQKRMQAMAVENAALHLESLEAEIGETDFHRWLTIARLQSRSRIAVSGNMSTDASEAEKWTDTLRLDDAMRW